MKTLSKFTSRFSLIAAFAFLFAAGCASVTDATSDLPETEDQAEVTEQAPADIWGENGDDMDPIIEKPSMDQ